MAAMPNTVLTLLVATVTAVVTTVATGLLVTPRLEARKRRIQEVHTARDTFSASVLTILSACSRLKGMTMPPVDDPDTTDVVRARITAERERWMQQLDDATRWMVDHIETFAISWPSTMLRNMVGTYVASSRMVMLSEREEATKVELLAELAAPIQDMLFTYWWRRARSLNSGQQRLSAALERIAPPDPAA